MNLIIREQLVNIIPGIQGKFTPFDKREFENSKFIDVHSEDFNSDKKSVDEILNDIIENLRANIQDNSVIFIPTVLNNKSVSSYLGVRLALHIRFDRDKNLNKMPIVLMGIEPETSFFKRCPYSDILKTRQCYYIHYTNEEIENFIKDIDKRKVKKLTGKEYYRAIERIHIKPPSNYHSHHSIDNELTLARWSEYIGCVDKIPDVKKNINTNLYFKYINALNPISEIKNTAKYLFDKKAEILLIDDEAKKGWRIFYESFFNNVNPNIEFKSIDFDFTGFITQKKLQNN